mmetsp:Transcript_33349/g.33969  ORF Transcript_33349/g.33969 Transcript_33349/m.33969 type:complete len:400 (+) Transcript_33349:126-1325(+)|eukprot:CAMPEP_0182417996 /NCGR_PEP_ID=MMETSP1167-20130531/2452_1 /TAXON_ID=2988 /ORGANISM="Mallomonas Sp, Strain CCMP3275" /LENGTH=399 /DNA_ID=CAMNT_0024591931 /DNA_START=26 /DNA_END=1225 /DNA_ORIENTATION=-
MAFNDQCKLNNVEFFEERPPKSIYFGGSAWGCAFYVGVFKAMEERWGKGFHKKTLITGDSSGALMAVGISLGFSADEMGKIYESLAKNASARGVFGKMGTLAESCLEFLLGTDPAAYKNLSGMYAVGTTKFPFNHQWHWNWESNRDLAECIIGSLHIPLYCERPSHVQGSIVVDGAYSMSGADLIHGDNTLYVGIDPHAEVGRSLRNDQMLFPLYDEEYRQVVDSGYLAMKNWDGRMNLKVGRRVPNYPVLLMMWPCRVLQLLIDMIHFFLVFLWRCLFFMWPGSAAGIRVKAEVAISRFDGTARAISNLLHDGTSKVSSLVHDGTTTVSNMVANGTSTMSNLVHESTTTMSNIVQDGTAMALSSFAQDGTAKAISHFVHDSTTLAMSNLVQTSTGNSE